jgi:hypothetical protein
MVARTLSALVIVGFAIGLSGAAPTVDVAAAEAGWSPYFVLTGTKTEPTYVEHVRLERAGDIFILEGGAPAGMETAREIVALRADGALSHLECPAAARCGSSEPPSGFLASAVVLAAIRHRQLSGRFPLLPYGGLELICIPAEQLGIRAAVLDPCIDIRSGAVVAQRHRRSGEFDGPTLDSWSMNISTSHQVASERQPPPK